MPSPRAQPDCTAAMVWRLIAIISIAQSAAIYVMHFPLVLSWRPNFEALQWSRMPIERCTDKCFGSIY